MKINFKLLILILILTFHFSLLTFNLVNAATINRPPLYLSSNNGLVGYWTMDGSKVNWATGAVTDSSGKGNTGFVVGTSTPMSTSTAPVMGKIGQALKFDGVDDTVNVGDVLGFAHTDAFSISLWYINRNSDYTTNPSMVSKRKSASPFDGYIVGIRGATAGDPLTFRLTGSGEASVNFTQPSVGVWHHLAVTYTGNSSVSGINAYVDGIPSSLTTVTNNLTGGITNTAIF